MGANPGMGRFYLWRCRVRGRPGWAGGVCQAARMVEATVLRHVLVINRNWSISSLYSSIVVFNVGERHFQSVAMTQRWRTFAPSTVTLSTSAIEHSCFKVFPQRYVDRAIVSCA